MSFNQAVRAAYGNYATFSGRAQRPEFWWFILFVASCLILLRIADVFLFLVYGLGMVGIYGAEPPLDLEEFTPLSSGFALITLVPFFAVSWRRAHDVGRSGLLNLLPILVITVGMGGLLATDVLRLESVVIWSISGATVLAYVITSIVLIVWLASRTQPGPNRFGPEPPAD